MHRSRLRKKLLHTAVVLLGVLLLWQQTAYAQETIFVSGNADLYPIESYDSDRDCYVGLMPELYERISAETGYAIAYLPYNKQISQTQQAQNRQADVISAYLPGTIDEETLCFRMSICTMNIDGEPCEIRIGFSDIMPQQQAQILKQAISDFSASERINVLADYAAANSAQFHQEQQLLVLAVLIAALLVSAAALIYIIREKLIKVKNAAMTDARYGIGNNRFYLHCMQTMIPEPMKSLYYVVCIGCETAKLEQYCTEAEYEQMLCDSAQIIKQTCRRGEYLSCVGNGIFALILQCDSRTEAKDCVTALLQRLDIGLEKYSEQYKGIFRAGICPLIECIDRGGETPLYNARVALAHAHEHDVRCAFVADHIIEERKQTDRLYHSMSLALKNSEFEPYFQFIVDRSGQIIGAELLSRWQNIHEGTLSPAKYIDMMIQNGMIVTHDLQMFRCACEQLQTWKRMGRTDLMLSCNFTRHSITDRPLADELRQIAEQYDFPRKNAIIEITENSLFKNRDIAQRNIKSIAELGFRIALDDIGSGYSALQDLFTFPLSIVKIDSKFLLDAKERADSKLLSGLIHLSHKMDLLVICEGVETQSLADIALAAGCDYMQGYLYSHVLPKSAAEKYVL